VGEALKMVIELVFKGTEVVTFTNAAEAMQELLREPPDLLTTDWNHVGHMCPEFFRHSLAQEMPYPIFVITASSDRIEEADVLGEFRDAGLDITLIPKPFGMADLTLHFAQYLAD
jgi:DNA-binding response OmpR family regulator